MLRETRAADAIRDAGFDDSPLVDLIAQAAQLASDHPEIVELDLNPIVLYDGGAVVTDAVVTIQRPATAVGPLRRL